MRLAVFGGSGRTGGELLDLASSRGWRARALVRSSSPCSPRPGLEVLRGSLDSSADLRATVEGAEAVLCVLGPRSTRVVPFCAAATSGIISAMRAAGSRRLLCLTGAMVGELPANVSFAMRGMAGLFRRQCPALAEDGAAQERVVMASDLEWTLVKPPRLTNGPMPRRVRADRALPVGLLSQVSRRGLAAFMLDEARDGRHIRERVYVRG